MKIRRIMLLTGLLTASAHASIPQGVWHGFWQVISISSMSGASGDDAAVMISQEVDGDELTVRWDEGGRVVISVDINECFADEGFEQTYAVPLNAWQALSNRARARHLKTTFVTWIEQARISCTKQKSIDKFQFVMLTRASDDFNRRLDEFAPRSEPSTVSGN